VRPFQAVNERQGILAGIQLPLHWRLTRLEPQRDPSGTPGDDRHGLRFLHLLVERHEVVWAILELHWKLQTSASANLQRNPEWPNDRFSL
jgi:hypothetical protein